MLAQEIIRIKRDGGALSEAQIQEFVSGLTDGRWSEGQVAALAMAVYMRGMSMSERVALTLAMMRSGHVMDWSQQDLPGPVLDKHSSGGVGDKVSLMLAPWVAACGACVPMISGRGLGHTGGTLDKLDTIAGYRSQPDLNLLSKTVREVGCAIVGQTADLAPADKRFYAIRDVTATVESVPLITASILSKKLAAGLQGLAMDVKVGHGAFCSTLEMARELVQSLHAVSRGAGLPMAGWISDMNQPLGWASGNALEVVEAIEFLTGHRREPRLWEVTRALAADMLLLGGLASDRADAEKRLARALDSGAAAERFERMVAMLGGPTHIITQYADVLASAPVVVPVAAPQSGWVGAMKTRDIGVLLIEMGGGRRKASDPIDPAVGLTGIVGTGDAVQAGQPLAFVHARDAASAQSAVQEYLACVTIQVEPSTAPAVLVEAISSHSQP